MSLALGGGMTTRTRTLIIGALLSGCGVSMAELTDDPRAQHLAQPSRRPVPLPDGGPIVTEPVDGGASHELPEEPVDAGAPEVPRDAGQPEGPRDAGQPQPVDAGVPTECTPQQTRTCATTCGSASSQTCAGDGRWGACSIPRESCTNGRDDDCDGFVDARDPECPPVVHTCESQDGDGCNGDMGYGDHCAASDNTAGCSPQRFWAWCNRRNPEYPNIWYAYVRNWVDDRCDGAVRETGTQYSTWYCTSSSNDRYECTTPLVVSFDGAPVTFEKTSASFEFTPGRPVMSDWPSSATPWLVRDVNRNGRIDDGSELFGSDTQVNGRTAANGFEALAALDENHDGAVDGRDAAFSELRLWRDADGDKRSTPRELVRLDDVGITSFRTRFEVHTRCDARGNCERERGSFSMTYGTKGALVDVHLKVASPATLVCSMR